MLDLSKFAKPRHAIVPVRNREFIYEKKHYTVNCEDGWTFVEMKNSSAKRVEPPLLADLTYSTNRRRGVMGYTHHNSIIFQNFDVAKRKFRLSVTAPLHFNQSQTFEAIKAVVWEDGQVYWCEPNYSDAKIFEIKDLYEQEHPITDQKGITPELRTVYIHHAVERDNMRKMLEAAKQVQERAEFMKSVPGRLQLTFKAAGAEMNNYSISGDRIVVDWKIPGSHYQYNSVIDSKTWMIVEAGYCMSGDDRRHNITSMVKTAQEYNEGRGHIYITRTTGNDDPTVRGPHLHHNGDDEEDW